MWYIPTHVKYKEVNDFWRNHTDPKVPYNTFKTRIDRYWYTDREKAITEKKYTSRRKNHWIYEDGRVCTKCKQRKPREMFAYTKDTVCHMTSKCKECRNTYHRELRVRQNYEVDRRYKEKYRKLTIWEHIALQTPRYIDWLPREDVYKVIDYKSNKWYLLQSIIDWIYTWIDTWNNPKSKKFYRVK